MSIEGGTYLLVLPVPAHRVDDGKFAIESAFAGHLRSLRDQLGQLATNIVVAAPSLSSERYEVSKAGMTIVEEGVERIRFVPMFCAETSSFAYLRSLPRIIRALYREISKASIVHSGPSPLFRPFELIALLIGSYLGKKTISVTDIDDRRSASMNYTSGRWNKKQFLVTRCLHAPYGHLQRRLLVRICSLVLLKGSKLTQDYGQNMPHVKNFLDAAFSSEQIISADRLRKKIDRLVNPGTTLNLAYFGRLVDYKGIDHMLRAISHAKTLGLQNYRFHLVGGGEAESGLKDLAGQLGLAPQTVFHGEMCYAALFDHLYDYHILLAAPLREDTPRSALDAMASGEVLLAYDTYYYQELRAAGAAVETVPWLDDEALGRRLFELSNDRLYLADLIRRGVTFAHSNTQELWLNRRVQWTQELFNEYRR